MGEPAYNVEPNRNNKKQEEHKMQPIKRKKDLMTGNEDIELLYTIPDFPVYLGTTKQPYEEDQYMDMKWGISKSSGMVQLMELVPNDILYADTHVAPVGSTWTRHNAEFSDFLHKYVKPDDQILEIGGANGILNAAYNRKYKHENWVIVEPSNAKPLEGCNARYIREYWNSSILERCKKPDVLVHCYLMEHVYDLHEFMKINAEVLDIGKKMVFAIPNIQEFLKKKYTQGMNFEHTFLLSDDYTEILMNMYGFKVLEKHVFDGVNSYYAVEHCDKKIQTALYSGYYEANKALFLEFVQYEKDLVLNLNDRMKEAGGRPIYLFGAHIFSQYLLKFGLKENRITYVLDNAKMKQNKRLYGTHLETRSPQILRDIEHPIVILKVSQYKDEIMNDIIENINPNTEFWE